MFKFDCFYLSKNSFFALFALIFIAVFAIGGCSDGNNGGGGGVNGSDTSQCTILTDPCSTINEFLEANPPYFECILSDTTCAVDLNNVINQLQGRNLNVDAQTRLWMSAWGGNGGAANENGGGSSDGGYTQTTTTVQDIVNSLGGESLLYYLLGHAGAPGGNHCGGAGGAATIVTFIDLTLTANVGPTEEEIFMLAGGGGGAGGGTIKGCTNPKGVTGGRGGITIAPESATPGLFFNAGAGCNGSSNGCAGTQCGNCMVTADKFANIAQGGGGNASAPGGGRTCCFAGQTKPNNGKGGIGGTGGTGGNGVKCTGPGYTRYRNAVLGFSPGAGGEGGGGTENCTTGGGGGGGGYGGGGGGGHGTQGIGGEAQGGGGGGSAAMSSTQDTTSTPTAYQTNPCVVVGCITINFFDE